MPVLARDVRHALRLLARSPGFTAVAVLTLAVGIGANTAVFSVTDALLLRPLEYPQPERLVLLSSARKSTGVRGGPLSWVRFRFLNERVRSFSGISAFTNEAFNLSGRGEPEQVPAARVSWNFFHVLGVQPAIGRTFRPEEDEAGGDRVVVISHALWTRLFAANPAAVGEHLALDGRDYTVIGVLPPGFRFDAFGVAAEIVATHVDELNLLAPKQAASGTMYLGYLARLQPGMPMARAQAEMDALAADYRRDNPKMPDADPDQVVTAGNLRDEIAAGIKPTLLILFGAVALVLLIACANVAGLLLSRALGRKREIAVRTAMGASRAEVIRQLLIESLMLALAGGVVGALLSAWGTRVLGSMARQYLPRTTAIHTDGVALSFTLGISLLAGVLFGLAPALRVSRPDLNSDLRSEGRGCTSGRQRNLLRSVLVVSQVALSMVLLIASGLLVRNFVQLRTERSGFDAGHLLTMKMSLPPARYAGGARLTEFYAELLRRIRALPGVQAAAVSSALPLTPARFSQALPEGQPMVPLVERTVFNIQTISPEYAVTMRLPLLRGREFTDRDDAKAPRVAIVNDTVARRYWPGQDAVGKHILLGRIVNPCEVVGVLGDVRNVNLAADVQPEIYVPFAQLPWPAMHLVVRTSGDPLSMTGSVRAALSALDRDLPVTSVRSMEEVLEAGAAQPRFTTWLLGSLAGMALLLALVGIYGLISFTVAERIQELGIRVALGAERADILRLVLRQGTVLALSGVAIGVAASLALTRLLASLLYHVSTTDPLIFGAGCALFVAVALLASAIPARRAMRVDPMSALRYE